MILHYEITQPKYIEFSWYSNKMHHFISECFPTTQSDCVFA